MTPPAEDQGHRLETHTAGCSISIQKRFQYRSWMTHDSSWQPDPSSAPRHPGAFLPRRAHRRIAPITPMLHVARMAERRDAQQQTLKLRDDQDAPVRTGLCGSPKTTLFRGAAAQKDWQRALGKEKGSGLLPAYRKAPTPVLVERPPTSLFLIKYRVKIRGGQYGVYYLGGIDRMGRPRGHAPSRLTAETCAQQAAPRYSPL